MLFFMRSFTAVLHLHHVAHSRHSSHTPAVGRGLRVHSSTKAVRLRTVVPSARHVQVTCTYLHTGEVGKEKIITFDLNGFW